MHRVLSLLFVLLPTGFAGSLELRVGAFWLRLRTLPR